MTLEAIKVNSSSSSRGPRMPELTTGKAAKLNEDRNFPSWRILERHHFRETTVHRATTVSIGLLLTGFAVGATAGRLSSAPKAPLSSAEPLTSSRRKS